MLDWLAFSDAQSSTLMIESLSQLSLFPLFKRNSVVWARVEILSNLLLVIIFLGTNVKEVCISCENIGGSINGDYILVVLQYTSN